MTDLPPEKIKERGWIKSLRDLLIFIGGLFGFAHEVFYGTTDRPFLLILCGVMMGIPGLIRLEELRKLGNGK